MTSEKPLGSQEQASDQSVFDDGFRGVVRAGGEETAVLSQQGREDSFVNFDQKENASFHWLR
jgi:hypothetical protein